MKTIEEKILKLRRQFSLSQLNEKDLPRDPIELLNQWLHEASVAEVKDFNAMTLATADKSGMPSARVVLLRSVDEKGLVFYTNYNSKKGKDIEENPQACLNFFWPDLERQIRITGQVEKIPEAGSDLYFSSRPRESQIGAWASEQSKNISSREVLDENIKKIEKLFADSPVKRPKTWGGYVVSPETVEFWQGRPSRLHDRIRYEKKDKNWLFERISP